MSRWYAASCRNRNLSTSKDPNSQVTCSGDDTLFPGPWGLLWGSCQGIPLGVPPRDPPGISSRESAQGFAPGSRPKGSSLGPKQMGSSWGPGGMPWGDAVGGSPGESPGDLPLVDQDCVVTRKGILRFGLVSLCREPHDSAVRVLDPPTSVADLAGAAHDPVAPLA